MGRLSDIKAAIASKKTSAVEVTKSFLDRAARLNPKINAYLEIFSEKSLAQAEGVDAGRVSGSLAGVPLAIKDMISIRDCRLSASSRMLDGYVAPKSATVTERLEQAGAVFLGRANCDEFAMGSSNENTAFGAVRNPFNEDYTAGGSSGGSAAAVRADLCAASLGTDTGGSIRLPAAFCGLVGLKPTYGRVSRSGVIAFASSLDQVGPFADDALDAAEVLAVIAGRDSRDPTSLPVQVEDYVRAAKSPQLNDLRIGIPKEFFRSEGMDPEVTRQIDQMMDVFKREKAKIIEISLPHTEYGIAVYYLVATAEAASNLSRYDGIRYGHRAQNFESLKDLIVRSRSEGFGMEVKRRIMLGTFSLSSGYYDAYYAKAQFVRSIIQREFLSVLKEVDLIFTPVSPTPAFKIGERINDPLKMYLSDIFTVTVNLAGLPAVSFPIGETAKERLPIGAQLIGRPFAEAQILSALSAIERAHPYPRRALA